MLVLGDLIEESVDEDEGADRKRAAYNDFAGDEDGDDSDNAAEFPMLCRAVMCSNVCSTSSNFLRGHK